MWLISTVSVSDEAGAGLFVCAAARWRSRSSGTYNTGLVRMSSLIFGWPDHALESVISACTLSIVRRAMPLRSFGSCSVRSFRVTFSVGHRLILVLPAIVSR